MIDALIRKGRQLAKDGVLRRWMLDRALGRTSGEPAHDAHRPAYAAALLPLAGETPAPGSVCDPGMPSGRLELRLPGWRVGVDANDLGAFLDGVPVDTETLLGLHRFAWLPLVGPGEPAWDPAWVAALWRGWRDRFGRPDQSWAWHPYTAAERAINLLAFFRRHGFPDQASAAELAAHAPVIAAGLEYFGDHHTSNHCANNGRGLYLLGLELGLPRAAELGLLILLAEAKRIFLPSGVLREGSSHYHLLLTRNYATCWLAACRHQRPEAEELRRVAAAAAAIVPHLVLPGGLPLVGDVSPDCPPDALAGLWRAAAVAGLDADEVAALRDLRTRTPPVDAAALADDGWLRFDQGDWSLLAYLSPEGFSHMPGHGHQDAGSFELHWRGVPVIVDPGRGAYGETGTAAFYRSALAHNGLTVGEADPFPANKPYYDADFRRRMAGAPPRLQRLDDGIVMTHQGFRRLGKGTLERRLSVRPGGVEIIDTVDSGGRGRLCRRLHLAVPHRIEGGAVVLQCGPGTLRLRFDAPFTIEDRTLWSAYGEGRPGHAVVVAGQMALPWRGIIGVEVV